VLKATVVLLVVSAAAVIIPLRRAQRAFAAISGHSGYSAAQRPLVRRRPSGPRASLRSAQEVQSQKLSAATLVVASRGRRVRTVAAATASKANQPRGERQQPAPQRLASAAQSADHQSAHHDCALLVGARQFPRPERLDASVSSSAMVVTAQAVGDTPVPPPKLA